VPDPAFQLNRVLGRLERRWRPHELRAIAAALAGARALEVGGPSAIFAAGGLLPVYPRLERLDEVNYAERTLWDDAVPAAGAHRSLIHEATDLASVGDGEYEAVLASHVLEHIADPIAALQEWHRVVRRGGHLLLVVPDRARTFDHRRPVTPLAHLVEDARRGTGEDDLTHLPEILELHDLGRDPLAGTFEAFERRSRENALHRGLHHHVFDLRSIVELAGHCGWKVDRAIARRPYHLVVMARKAE
jgi:SAM-dependent methyltransferase